MKVRRFVAAALLAAAASSASALTIAESTFDDDAEGWTAFNGFDAFTWAGGHIQATDASADSLWSFAAPAAYRGDITAAYGGTLSYSLITSTVTGPLVPQYFDVQILGVNGVLLSYHSPEPHIVPVASWRSFTVPLVSNADWTVGSVSGPVATPEQMLAVLSNVSALRIRGDYRQSTETTALDNVVLASAVPEPGAGAMALAGLAVLVVLWRRR